MKTRTKLYLDITIHVVVIHFLINDQPGRLFQTRFDEYHKDMENTPLEKYTRDTHIVL